MSKEFFYSIAFRNVSSANILQNRIALKPVLHHAKTYGCELKGSGKRSTLATASKDWNMVAKEIKIGAIRKLLKNRLFRPVNASSMLLLLNTVRSLLRNNIKFLLFDTNSNISDFRATLIDWFDILHNFYEPCLSSQYLHTAISSKRNL